MALKVFDLILLISFSAATARKKLMMRKPKPETMPKTRNMRDQKLTLDSWSPRLEKTARISAKMMAKAGEGGRERVSKGVNEKNIQFSNFYGVLRMIFSREPDIQKVPQT